MTAVLALLTVFTYFVVPGIVALTRGRTRAAILVGQGLLFVGFAATAVLLRGSVEIISTAAVLFANGLLIAICAASLASPRLPFWGKYLGTAAATGLLALQWALIIPRGDDLILDVSNRALVGTLRALSISPQNHVVDVGVRWLLPSLTFVISHPVAVGLFFTWVGAYLLLVVLHATLPWAFEPDVPPLSRQALDTLRLPGRRILPATVLASWAAAQLWPALGPVVEALLGTYAAWALSGLILAMISAPRSRAPIVLLLGGCSLCLPLTPILSLAGLADHVLGVRRLLPEARTGTVSLPFRGFRSPRRYAAAVAAYLAVFALLHPVLAPPAGSWLGAAPTRESSAGFEVPPPNMIFQGRPDGPFWIDEYEYPNDPTVPPQTEVTYQQAEASCLSEERRLCSEEEWLFACEELVGLAGDPKRDPRAVCGDMADPEGPGRRSGCRSSSGTHALMGGVWEWTAGSQTGYHVLKGPADGMIDDIRFSCHYRFFVHELQEPVVDLGHVGFRCCRDAVRVDRDP